MANALRLLGMPEDVQELIHTNQLSSSHGKVLLKLPPGLIQQWAEVAVQEQLTVGALEDRVEQAIHPKPKPKKIPEPSRLDPSKQWMAEDGIIRKLGLNAEIRDRGEKGGQVEIRYRTLAELRKIIFAICPVLLLKVHVV